MDNIINIILVGFMGTGKSAVGKELATQLGWSFVDTDREIERETGLTIREIFRRYGEGYFRRWEAETIHRVTEASHQVIATGGGAIIVPANRERLRSRGVVVCLQADPETILARVGEGNDRPLLQGTDPAEQIRRLLAEREPYYRQADVTIDTSRLTARACAELILDRLGWSPSGFALQLVRVSLPQTGYNIYIRPGILPRVTQYLPAGLGRAVLVVSDRRVGSLYGQTLVAALEEAGFTPRLALVEEGEEAKTLARTVDLYQEALAAGLDRHSPVIALGGGVVGDQAGFVAATYMRGVPFLQVPTTLLAQVDSSVGGKVGVNLPQGKNLVGAFYQPLAVYIDPTLLVTLPPRELRAGLAEVVKYALVFSPELFAYLEAELPRLLKLESGVTGYVVAECCRLKAAVVGEDEREKGKRMLLNFGHTIGHALEAATGFRVYRHGEAVAVGMIAACRLSAELGVASPELGKRLEYLLARIGLPTTLGGVSIEAVRENLIYDKKARGKKVPFILLRDMGQPVIKDDIPEEVIATVLASLQD